MNSRPLTDEDIGKRCPVCPQCHSFLIARDSSQRFVENNSYVECIQGHVFQLAASDAEEAVKEALDWVDVYEDNMSSGDFATRTAAVERARKAVTR